MCVLMCGTHQQKSVRLMTLKDRRSSLSALASFLLKQRLLIFFLPISLLPRQRLTCHYPDLLPSSCWSHASPHPPHLTPPHHCLLHPHFFDTKHLPPSSPTSSPRGQLLMFGVLHTKLQRCDQSGGEE